MTDISKNFTGQPYGIIKRLVENILMDVHVCLPGKVNAYDYATQKADVKPLIKRKFRDGTSKELPVIPSVPVVFPRVNDSYIYLPIKAGDKVLIFIADYSIDNYLFGGTESEPLDLRAHHLTDAFCIPGGYDFHNPIDDLANDDDVIIKNADSKVTLKPDGTFSVVGKDGVDLVSKAHALAEAGEAITTITSLGIMPTVNKATFTSLKGDLAKIKI